MKSIFIIVILIFCFTYSAKAHQDVARIGNFDFHNVKIKITHSDFTWVNKFGIMGKLTKNLCEKYSYYDSVLVDFCLYQSPMLPDYKYLISYDNSCKRFINEDTKLIQEIESEFTKDFICIYAPESDFNPENVLKIVEYSIKNKNDFHKMKFHEYDITFEGNYIFGLDTNIIK